MISSCEIKFLPNINLYSWVETHILLKYDKNSHFLRKEKFAIKFPQFREFSLQFRETWRSRPISGDSRKFRETWAGLELARERKWGIRSYSVDIVWFVILDGARWRHVFHQRGCHKADSLFRGVDKKGRC